MIFVSLNSNTRDITNGPGTAYPSGAPEAHSDYSEVRVVQSLAFCVVCSTSCFPKVFAIVLSVLRFTDCDYFFGIFKLLSELAYLRRIDFKMKCIKLKFKVYSLYIRSNESHI